MEIEPDLNWYMGLSKDRGVSPRCPFANVDSCPRFWSSLSLLEHIGHTKISKLEDDRLKEKWLNSDLYPRISEHETSISGGETSKCLSNYCPEVTFQSFGFFANLLCQHGDEIDRDLAYQLHERNGVPSGSWKWSWWALNSMHFTECPLYSQLLHRAANPLPELDPKKPMSRKTSPKPNSKIFIVHGHDDGVRESVARFLEKGGLSPIILMEQPNLGRTVIEKFVGYAEEVTFAIVLLTPDDLGGLAMDEEQRLRARQNVVFELGYFTASLGRGRVCLLQKGNVEIPSDLFGVVYTKLDQGGGWKIELARELRGAGIPFDKDEALA